MLNYQLLQINRAITHDPKTYQHPALFNPDRFLTGEKKDLSKECDPYKLVFGFGRRICPGRLLADATLFLIVAKSLAVFNVRKPLDRKTGKFIEPKVEFAPGIISHPIACKVIVECRNLDTEQLIRAIEVDDPWPRTEDAKILDVI